MNDDIDDESNNNNCGRPHVVPFDHDVRVNAVSARNHPPRPAVRPHPSGTTTTTAAGGRRRVMLFWMTAVVVVVVVVLFLLSSSWLPNKPWYTSSLVAAAAAATAPANVSGRTTTTTTSTSSGGAAAASRSSSIGQEEHPVGSTSWPHHQRSEQSHPVRTTSHGSESMKKKNRDAAADEDLAHVLDPLENESTASSPDDVDVDVIVVSTVDGTLAGLSRATGRILWQRSPNPRKHSTVSYRMPTQTPGPSSESDDDPQKVLSGSEAPPLLEPHVSTTTTTTSHHQHQQHWKTAAVPSILDGKVYLTATTTTTPNDVTTATVKEEVTVTASIRDLVDRAPFVDVRGRIYTAQRQSVAVAVDRRTGDIVQVLPPDQAPPSQSQQQQQQQSKQSPTPHVVWMGRVDSTVAIHEPRTGELDVQFTSAELMSVQDMLLKKTTRTGAAASDAGSGPWHPQQHPGAVQHLLSSPQAASPSDQDREDADEPIGSAEYQESRRPSREEHQTQVSSSSRSSSIGSTTTTIITTPGGHVAYRNPNSGEIAWVTQVSFATPVAFALDATTGTTLGVEIVPDAVVPNGSTEYLLRELQRQLDRQQQQQQINDSPVDDDDDDDDESIVGVLPGTGQLYAMPLGKKSRHQRPHAATTKAGVSATHHQPQLIAAPGRQHQYQHAPHLHHETMSHGFSYNPHHYYQQYTGAGDPYYPHSPPPGIRKHGRHESGNFLSGKSGTLPFEVAADGGIVPFFHPDYGYQYIPPEHFYTIHNGQDYYQKRKYKKMLKLLGSWLPPLCALLLVSSFEMGRRKRARDNLEMEANDKETNLRRQTHDDDDDKHSKDSSIIEVCEDVVLGHGGHGTMVYKGKLDGRQVAVKRMLKTYHASADREISLLIESDGHPNVVRYFLKEIRGDFVYLALELCDLSLHDLIGSIRSRLTAPSTNGNDDTMPLRILTASKAILYQITQGVVHLHCQRIVHRDLKPANILLADSRKSKRKSSESDAVFDIFEHGDYIAKISDMGLGKQLVGQSSYGGGSMLNESSLRGQSNGQSSIIGVGPGSVGWQAPEVMALRMPVSDCVSVKSDGSTGHSDSLIDMSPLDVLPGARTSRSVDIFSLGCVFYSFLVPGSHPFGEWYEREANIMRDRPNLHALEEISLEAHDLVAAMLRRNPSARPTAKQIADHPFFWTKDRRLSFLCDFSDRLETDSAKANADDSSAFLAMLLTVERDASKVVGTSWDLQLHRDLVSNVQRFRSYDPSSIRDLLRLLRNKHHHFDELPVSLRGLIGSKSDGLMEYFDKRFSRLVIHCFRVCQELYAADDPLSTKYGIALAGYRFIGRESGRNRLPSKPEQTSSPSHVILEQTAKCFGADEGDKHVFAAQISEESCEILYAESSSFGVPSVAEEADDNKPRNVVSAEAFNERLEEENIALQPESSNELIVWHGSKAASTLGCRGWNRSDSEWECRLETSTRRRDDALLRCAGDPKFRTRLCNHWDESMGSSCSMRKKGKCIFAHGPVELRVKEGKRHRWGKLVDKNGDNNNPKHSGGEDTYGAARAIESERKHEGKWKTSHAGASRGKSATAQKKKTKHTSPALSVIALGLLGLSLLTFSAALRPTVLVCQNKDCCQRWRHQTPLPEVLVDLLGDSVSLQTTSCLSQCGKGPNLCVRKSKGEELQLQMIHSPTVAAAVLEESLNQKIPSKLLAAVNVLERAYKATSGDEQDRFVSSIIKTLEADDELRFSTANCRAYIFRAEMCNKAGRLEDCIADSKRAIELLSPISPRTGPLIAKAYRLLADTYEQAENWTEAIAALQGIIAAKPDLRKKILNEVERIKQRAS